MSHNVALILPLVALLIPIILVPTILGLRHARIDRELEHRERMRALELGRTLPKDEPWWSPGRIALAIGAGVPMVVFFLAWMTTDSVESHTPWISAGIVAMTAVLCGSFLAHRHLIHVERAEARGAWAEKPRFNADEYDMSEVHA
jgi:hypothetical protein